MRKFEQEERHYSPCLFPHAPPEWKRQSRLSAARHNQFNYQEILERAKEFQPSTPTLARLCSIFSPGSRNRD